MEQQLREIVVVLMQAPLESISKVADKDVVLGQALDSDGNCNHHHAPVGEVILRSGGKEWNMIGYCSPIPLHDKDSNFRLDNYNHDEQTSPRKITRNRIPKQLQLSNS